MSDLSWLNPTPHAIAVYASQPLSPVATQHSLPSGRYSLLGPDFHRLDRTSFAWRTHSITSSARASTLRERKGRDTPGRPHHACAGVMAQASLARPAPVTKVAVQLLASRRGISMIKPYSCKA